MNVRSAVALLSTLSIVAISPASAALRGNIFDDTNTGNGNGSIQKNNQNKGYNEMVHDIKASLENGESLGEARVKQLEKKFKKEKLKVNGKKKMLKDAAVKVLERNKNKGENITEYALLMETLSELTDQELQNDLLSNIDDGYAEPEDLDTVDPRAGELEDMEELEDEDNRRRLGVPTTRNRWANGIVRYKLVFERNYAGYYMWANRAFPAMMELESITNLQFQYAGGVWTSADAQNDGTVYLRVRSSGCSAQIGAPPSWSHHYINIGPNCSHGNILHEFLHTAGMHHQQVAQYRDKYITVNFQNIQSQYASNFFKKENHGLEFVYDYGSIMHYGEYGFSTNNQKSIDCRGNSCGQRGGLSFWDTWEIIYYYYGYYFVNGNL